MMSTHDAMIQVKNLVKTYGRGKDKVEAVRGLDLEVPCGQIFGLVGPDGAGKTTTIQLLTGILVPTSGQIRVAGVNVVQDSETLGGKIGYMSESFSLFGELSVEENIDFFAQLYQVSPHVAAERKEQLLRFARMENARERRAKHLSGGMKKKLALACTLIYRPQVLFLDEPTTGVDPVSRQDFWKILYEFLAEGITIFVSTPYMDEAERCNQVGLLSDGKIITNDAPSALKQSIQGITMEMIARPQKRAVSMLRSTPGVAQVQIFGDRLHLLLTDGAEGVHELPGRLEQCGIKVESYHTASPSLEDVFISSIEERRATDEKYPQIDYFSGLLSLQGFSGTDDRPPTRPITVQAENLTRRFGSFTAVDRVSFTVRSGEIFGFLGPNGSGKTTTIRMLAGLLSPSAGSGTVNGLDVVRQRVRLKNHIGYMSQKFSLYNDLTVAENIRFYGSVYDLPPEQFGDKRAWVLEMAGLTGKEHLLTRDLSGGWKQRLALGCAILHEPEILFLDEPTSGVDPVSRRHFWDLIFALSQQGVTIFVTTHYMDEAEHCHELGLLYQGRLIARGSPADLRANMKLGSLLEITVRDPLTALSTLRGLPQIIQTSIYGDKLHVLVWDRVSGAKAVEAALHTHGLCLSTARDVPISLEDLFNLFIELDETSQKAKEDQ